MIVSNVPLNMLREGEHFTTRITRAEGTVLKAWSRGYGDKEYQVALTYPNGKRLEKIVRSDLPVNA